MKIFTPRTVYLALLIAAVAYGVFQQNEHLKHHYFKIKKTEEFKDKKHPGWYEQYHRMKQNEQGVIPRGIIRTLHKELMSSTLQKTAAGDDANLWMIQELGPNNIGGRTRALLVDAANPNHLIAGGISGGIWNSYDAGQSWQQVNDFATTLSVSCITQDHFDANIIYYGTGEGAGNSADIAGNGIFKSTDGGKTFAQLPATDTSLFDYIWSIKADPSRPDAIYVGTKGKGLFRSQNGGNSFERVYNYGDVQDIEVLEDGTVLFTRKGSGIYKSPTGDAGTFTKLTDILPSFNFQRIEIAAAPSNEGVLYAAFQDNGTYYSNVLDIYKSIDTGSTWANITNNFDVTSYDFPWYCFTMGVKTDDPGTVYIGTVRLQYSTNGGASWATATMSHADHHAIVFDPADFNRLYVGNDGGVYRYPNAYNPLSYDDLNYGYNITQFYAGSFFPAGNDFIAGAQDNGTVARRNENPVVAEIFGADGAFNAINQQDPNISYVSYQNGEMFKAYNTFDTYPDYWSNQVMSDPGDGTWFINPFEMDPNDNDILYYVTYSRIFRTNDGQNFNPLTNSLSGGTPYAVGISKAPANTIYVGGDQGLFYRIDSADAAQPGDEISLSHTLPSSITGSFISSIKVHPANDSICYVAFSNFISQPRIWKVTAAKTDTPVWVSIHGNLPVNLAVNWVEADHEKPDSILFIGTDLGLFSTRDGGQNWIYENAVIPHVPVFMLRVRESDRKLFVFTHGRGTFSGIISTEPIYSSVEPESNSLKNAGVKFYPNPATDYLQVEVNKKSVATIYSISGQRAQKMSLLPGKNSMNISGLPSGVYLLQLEDEEGGKHLQKVVVK